MSVELRDSVSQVFTGLQLKEAGTSSNATHTLIYFQGQLFILQFMPLAHSLNDIFLQ
jgi:hypothetical protein